ncbi:spore germination protein GerPC [Heyndrickxia acidicola]|uniref:Spore germination protein GerPC n=1 Tax=Heyndrickxia acidicola TaxID=209389 RepID=A0ABU6MCT4_9BACI|nr:spore germination protein GerPC [Heyndrickxia acidicola]MED1202480.1 spore germination protein GerPC [Heyndrickxia acidicola]
MDFRTQLNQLYEYIHYQEGKIANFEKLIEKLSNEIQTLKEKPPINVEKIEYKFDQLKIERLDGTLNIGLSPTDLGNIEDMGLPAAQAPTPPPFFNAPEFKSQAAGRIQQYLNENLKELIQDTENQLNMRLTQDYHDFIYQDLTGQIPQRVDHYIQMLSNQNLSNVTEDQISNQIFDQMKADIQQAVFMFLSKLPKTMNGGNQNGN